MAAGYKFKNALSLFLFVIACGVYTSGNTAANSAEVLEPAAPLSLSTAPETSSTYEYILEGRADPFVPFLSKKASTTAQLNPDEIMDEDIELSGMRQFEPGQLTLVAVLEASSKKIAMVEDVTGKGYMLNEGTAIGRRGIVTKIDLQQVLITETAHTRAGKEIKTPIVMRMNKEGEQ